MSSRPEIKLSHLRQIGWDYWDPIGIRDLGSGWKAEAADEYDNYLLQVANMLDKGQCESDATAYLVQVAESHMGLCSHPEHAPSAARTVGAIRAYLNELNED